MDMETSRTLLGARPDLIDHFSTIDEVVQTVADVLTAIEDMDGLAPQAYSLARAARSYLEKVGKPYEAIHAACLIPMSVDAASQAGEAVAR